MRVANPPPKPTIPALPGTEVPEEKGCAGCVLLGMLAMALSGALVGFLAGFAAGRGW